MEKAAALEQLFRNEFQELVDIRDLEMPRCHVTKQRFGLRKDLIHHLLQLFCLRFLQISLTARFRWSETLSALM
jgi:hypothetical protein